MLEEATKTLIDISVFYFNNNIFDKLINTPLTAVLSCYKAFSSDTSLHFNMNSYIYLGFIFDVVSIFWIASVNNYVRASRQKCVRSEFLIWFYYACCSIYIIYELMISISAKV